MYPTQMHCWGGAGNRAWVEGSDWDRDEGERWYMGQCHIATPVDGRVELLLSMVLWV